MAENRRWWESESDILHKDVWAAAERVRLEHGTARRDANRICIGLYENRDLDGVVVEGVNIPTELRSAGLTLNVCSSCVDVLAAKIATNKPKPQYLTVDGDFSAQQKAKNRQRFVMGNFQGGEVYRKSIDVWMDSAICDIGAMKLFDDNGKVGYERTFPSELLVDSRAAQDGNPRELFQEKWVSTDVLAAAYPDKAEQIKLSASRRLGEVDKMSGMVDDMVRVYEAWHLPSGPGAKDGKRAIVVEHAVLVEEEWTDDSFPFAFLRWTKLREGFWGQGLVEQLAPLQSEITELLDKIQKAHRLLGVPWVLRNKGSEFNKGALTNQPGEIIDWDGAVEPKVQVHGIMAPEVYTYLDYCFQKAFEVSGVSQLSAMSKKPAGIESGVALRTLLDTETQRFAMAVDAWQQFFLDLARETTKCARRIGNPTATWRSKEWARQIPWKDVAGEEGEDDRFVLQLWPVNLLPDTPAGKLAYVEQMITMGLVSPDQGQSLLDFPDIEAFQRTNSAAKDMVDMMIEAMLTTGRYIAPSKHMPIVNPDGSPGMAIHVVQGALMRGKVNDWPDDKLAMLSQWLDEAIAIGKEIMAMLQPPAPEPMAAPGAPGPAPGVMPPGPMGGPGNGAGPEMPPEMMAVAAGMPPNA